MRESGGFKLPFSSHVLYMISNLHLNYKRVFCILTFRAYEHNLDKYLAKWAAGERVLLLKRLEKSERVRAAVQNHLKVVLEKQDLPPQDVHAAGQRAGLMNASNMLRNMANDLNLDVRGEFKNMMPNPATIAF